MEKRIFTIQGTLALIAPAFNCVAELSYEHITALKGNTNKGGIHANTVSIAFGNGVVTVEFKMRFPSKTLVFFPSNPLECQPRIALIHAALTANHSY